MVMVFLFNFFTTPLLPIVTGLIDRLPFVLPEEVNLFFSRILSLIALCLLILVLGVIARHFLFKHLLQGANHFFLRIPFVKGVYKIVKDVTSALFSTDGKQGFKGAVMVPFPERPHFCIGFSSGKAAAECEKKAGKQLVAVFSPTAPHPISGFLFLVDPKDVYSLDMTKEDALKYLISCGMIVPESDASS